MFQRKIDSLGEQVLLQPIFKKKEKSAKALVEFFTKYFWTGDTIGALYPFNFAFYKKMGFGYATEYMFR